MSCINCGNEIHALRCDRASILHELGQVKEERDALAVRLENALVEGAKRREERDALQAKLDRLWDAFVATTVENSVYTPAELEDALCGIFADEGGK